MSSSSFSVGDLVCVGKSVYPAKIVAFLNVDKEMVEVEWLDSGGAKWERIHPIKTLSQLGGGRRRRVQTSHFTETNKTEEEENNASSRKRGRRAAASPKKKTTTRSNNSTASKKKKKPYHPKQLRPIKMEPDSKPPSRASKKPPAAAQRRRKRRMLDSTSVARRPHSSNDDGSDDSSDDSSDDELLARARRVSRGKRALFYSSDDDDDDDDRKPAAAKSTTSTSLSNSSDSSDDEITRTRARRKGRKVVASKRKKLYSSSDSSKEEHELLARRRRTRLRRRAPASSGSDDDSSSAGNESESEDVESGGDEESASDVASQESVDDNGGVVKSEQAAPLPLLNFRVGDHVWIHDGDKHPALVIALVNDDMLAVKWASGSTGNNIVPRTSASRMFDLTENANDGRPRRSTRARRKPVPLGAVPVKKEPPPRARKGTSKKETRARAAKLKNKKAVGKSKKKPGHKPARKQSKKRLVFESDSDTDESDIVSTEKVRDPVALDSSSDSDSDAESLVTEATFEYTAPHIDPKYRSLHCINTDLEADSFMTAESWKKVPNVARVSRDEQKETEVDTRVGGGSKVYDVEVSPPPRARSHNDSASVLEGEKNESMPSEYSRLLQETPSRLDNERDAEDGDGSPPFASLPSGIGASEEERSHRQSTETANPDELPDILLQGDTEPTANEERLTADSQELTRTFAAFGESDLSTQPEAMCM